ncbi:MAG TPA: hypothetical protein VGL87_09085 [Steroidobacteraceae bacterium]
MQFKTFIELAGWLGALLILGAYGLMTAGRLQARSALYQWMNIVGAVGFIINSGWKGAWPSAWLNIVWLAIGIYGITRSRRTA